MLIPSSGTPTCIIHSLASTPQHVAYDYASRLSKGLAAVDAFLGPALAQVTGDATLATSIGGCPLANVSICATTEAGTSAVLLSIHNPESVPSSNPVRIPVGFPAGEWL